MRYFILAGEASGDLHSAALATALRSLDPEAEISGWGGDEMAKAGVQILKHYRELAFMGFVEVLRHLPQIMRNFRHAKQQITAFRPDALILTDYPGFNLRMARWAHNRGIPVHYYISPQLWAWKESRVKIIRRYVDQMYVILPFEKAFYAKHGIEAHFVGHPLAWRIGNLLAQRKQTIRKDPTRRIALLPGSRRREIAYMLPVMLEALRNYEGYQVYVAGAPSIPPQYYYDFIRRAGGRDITLTFGYTYQLLQQAEAALCTSGTATLETALFGVPQVVCYKGDTLSYRIARKLIRVPYIAMINLICNRAVVPELIQHDFTSAQLRAGLREILRPDSREEILAGYRELRGLLGSGDPAGRVAAYLVASLRKS